MHLVWPYLILGMLLNKLLTHSIDFSQLSKCLFALALLCLFLLGLDASLLFDVDEGAFTEATREMLVSRDWGHTTLNGLDRFDKPIGVYWLQAVSVLLLGVNEFAFRLPSALSGWLASLALAHFAQQQWGYRAAVTAAIISATSLGPWAMARTATADALLGLFFVLIYLDLWRSLNSISIWQGRRVALWMALGLLVKGPVALVLPVGALLISAVAMPEFRGRIKVLVQDLWSWVILALVSLPWYLYALMRHGQNFIDGFILKHNVERFTGSMEGHSGHWAYFLVALPLLWLPWSALWFSAVFNVHKKWKQPVLQFAWIWFGFVFVFFTLANTKLPHYLLYAGPAMCLLVTESSLTAGKRTWILTWLFAVLGLSVLLLLPSYVNQSSGSVSNEYYKILIAEAPQSQMWMWLFAIPLPLFAAYGVRQIFKVNKDTSIQMTNSIGFISFAIFHALILSLVALPWWSQVLQSPVHSLATILKNRPETAVQWGVHLPSFATYREREAPRREPVPGELALVKNQKPYWPSDWELVEVKGPLAIVKSPEKLSLKP